MYISLSTVTQDGHLSAPSPRQRKYSSSTFSDGTTTTTRAINKFIAHHTCMQMCLPYPGLRIPRHLILAEWQGRGDTPPALICPICRVRNNKSAAKNKRCENCCQFAVAPTRSENSGKILFQQIKSTCYQEEDGKEKGREGCKLWGNMMALLGIFYHLNARHTGVNFEYPGRRPSHSRSCHPESASESESVPSAYHTLWCRASSDGWAHAWTGQGQQQVAFL